MPGVDAQMWFGTEEYQRWIPAPQSGADVSPTGRNESGTLISGGGYVSSSYMSHRVYQYSWSDASNRNVAQVLKNYASGTYGRGLLYFIDPLTYDTNILPANWADPSMCQGFEAPLIRPDIAVAPTVTSTANYLTNDLPIKTVGWTLTGTTTGYPGAKNSLFIPVPSGYTLQLGAIYTFTGNAGFFWAPVDASGNVGTATKLTAVAQNATNLAPDVITPGARGIRLWMGLSAAATSTITVTAITGRMYKTGTSNVSAIMAGPWNGGQGHTGCRVDGKPTYIEYNGVNGGQVGMAMTLRETGAWEL